LLLAEPSPYWSRSYLEDETGFVNVVVWERVFAQREPASVGSRDFR
jgi:hypothetical protein